MINFYCVCEESEDESEDSSEEEESDDSMETEGPDSSVSESEYIDMHRAKPAASPNNMQESESSEGWLIQNSFCIYTVYYPVLILWLPRFRGVARCAPFLQLSLFLSTLSCLQHQLVSLLNYSLIFSTFVYQLVMIFGFENKKIDLKMLNPRQELFFLFNSSKLFLFIQHHEQY